MRTIILKEKDFKNGIYCGGKDLFNIEGNLEIEKSGWCRFEDNISADGDISAEGDIFVDGNISADGNIFADGDISVNGGILKALYGITAGLKIFAKTKIECGMRIFAGVAPWSWVNKEHREIKCGKLVSGEIGYGDLIETELEETAEIIELNGVKYKRI